MQVLTIYIFLSSFGILGIVFLIGRRVLSARFLSQDEKKVRIDSFPPFFEFVKSDVIIPLEGFAANVVRPALFKLGEKFLRRFRIVVLKAEAFLHRLSDYFHGKRVSIKNGAVNGSDNGPDVNKKNDAFWNEMQQAKKEAQNGFTKTGNKK